LQRYSWIPASLSPSSSSSDSSLKDPALANEDWSRFLPTFKKKNKCEDKFPVRQDVLYFKNN
jgi:hypothetical protein